MATHPPFLNNYGTVTNILTKAKAAATPERFTQDFLKTHLGFKSGNAQAFIPLAKRLKLLNSDGTPTDIYKSFRNPNPTVSKAAMAQAIRSGYADLYARNENLHTLDRSALEGLIVEATGLSQDSPTIRAIVKTFEALKAFADFGAAPPASDDKSKDKEKHKEKQGGASEDEGVDLRLSYTINLVLPKTTDVAVFNAIFKSLKENLLRK
ncbi:MAG: DUF5343 domain-containing protein [Verrucomicrobiota bacterium]